MITARYVLSRPTWVVWWLALQIASGCFWVAGKAATGTWIIRGGYEP